MMTPEIPLLPRVRLLAVASAVRELLYALRVIVSAVREFLYALRVIVSVVRAFVDALQLCLCAVRVLFNAVRVFVHAQELPVPSGTNGTKRPDDRTTGYFGPS